MQFGPTNYFLHDPSAASITTNPNYPGEFTIVTNTGEILVQGQANMTKCALDCAKPCIPQQFTVTFPDADFGNCDSCKIIVGFSISRGRATDFDIATDPHLLQNIAYNYPMPDGGGVVTGATLATYFAKVFTDAPAQADITDNFHITASAAGNVLTLIVPCHYKVQLFQLPNSGGYTPTFVNTVVGQEAFLTKEQLKRIFPKDINQIPGQWLDTASFSDCESVCILHVEGCYDACADINLDRRHHVALGSAATKVAYDIFVNSLAPGYNAFIAAIAANITTAPTCSGLTATQGSSTPFATGSAAAWAAGVNIVTAGLSFSATSSFQISNGVVQLTVTAASAAALAAALVADPSTGITSAYAAPNLTVTGFGASIITIRQVSF